MGQTTLNIHPSAGSGGPTPPPPKDLYAKRLQIYPKLAHGKFRLVKWGVMASTLAIYYLLPFLRWNRGEGFPDQALLIDLPARKAWFFGIEIWAQEIYYVTGLLILAASLDPTVEIAGDRTIELDKRFDGGEVPIDHDLVKLDEILEVPEHAAVRHTGAFGDLVEGGIEIALVVDRENRVDHGLPVPVAPGSATVDRLVRFGAHRWPGAM